MTDRQRSIKAAFGLLLKDVGGVDAASALLDGYGKGHLSQAASPFHDSAPRVDHVLALEEMAQRPRVTQILALALRMRLVPMPDASGIPGAALAEVLDGAGELGRRAMLALADGELTEAERAGLVEQLAELGRAVEQAQSVIAGPRAALRRVG